MIAARSCGCRVCRESGSKSSLDTRRVSPKDCRGQAEYTVAIPGFRRIIDGVGRQSGPSTLRTTRVRPRRVKSSVNGTEDGYNLYVRPSAPQK